MAQRLIGKIRRLFVSDPLRTTSDFTQTDFTDRAKFLALPQRSPCPHFSFLPIALPEVNHRTWNLLTRWYSPRVSTFNSVYPLSNLGRIPSYFNISTSSYLNTIPEGKRYLGSIYTGCQLNYSVPKKPYFGVEINSEVSHA